MRTRVIKMKEKWYDIQKFNGKYWETIATDILEENAIAWAKEFSKEKPLPADAKVIAEFE